jgi:hypothetical protein
MAIKMIETFKKIGPKYLSDLEMRIGFSLPEPYKKFLLKSNGGRIVPNNFQTVNNEIESGIHYMFGITDNANYDIESNYNNWAKNNPQRNLVPIAIDSLGNLILLSCSTPTYESVYIWQHDLEGNLYLIATDFNSFLKSLYEIKIEQSDLDLAVARQDIKYFENRLLKGENIDDIINEFNQPVVIVAALYNKVGLLKYFKQKGSKLAKALFNAASNGSHEAVKYLLSLGINPDERDEEQNNDTALMQAAFGGYLNVVKELIKMGADINAKDINGQSVLTKALWSGNDELVQYLEKHGAK